MGESDSITGQKRLIYDWAAERGNVRIQAVYCDDGFSGANFDRPAFKQMMRDASRHLFDTIIVKDLSRFGRNYLDCGGWMERLLPEIGIRLYSIADSYDSMEGQDYNTALLLPMKNLMNEMHVVNTSQKVRTSLEAKRRRGEFVGNFAPYGYRKDPVDKHRLIVDEEAAKVVRRIFEQNACGKSASAIARELNEEDVPSPALYRARSGCGPQGGFKGSGEPVWHAETVLRILRNEVYQGRLMQGRTRKVSWRTKATCNVPREDWAVVEHAHEAIIAP